MTVVNPIRDEYAAKTQEIKDLMEQFVEAAEGGQEGRGSKTKSLQARKLSMQITNELKDYRAVSIKNDKEK